LAEKRPKNGKRLLMHGSTIKSKGGEFPKKHALRVVMANITLKRISDTPEPML
jgi:hypothetical protein